MSIVVVLSVVSCTLSAVCKNKHANSLGCFVQYRVAFYVAGELESLNNAFMLIDGYLQYKNKQLARATPFEVHIHPHTAVGDLSSLRDQMSYPSITVHEASESLPLKWSQSHPCMGKKILCFFFEPIGTSELSFVLTGTRFLFCHSPSLAKNTRAKATPGTFVMTSRGLGSREAGPRTTDTTVS